MEGGGEGRGRRERERGMIIRVVARIMPISTRVISAVNSRRRNAQSGVEWSRNRTRRQPTVTFTRFENSRGGRFCQRSWNDREREREREQVTLSMSKLFSRMGFCGMNKFVSGGKEIGMFDAYWEGYKYVETHVWNIRYKFKHWLSFSYKFYIQIWLYFCIEENWLNMKIVRIAELSRRDIFER